VKRFLLALCFAIALLNFSTEAGAATGKVVSCSTISLSKSLTKGISLPCLDSKSRVIYQAIRGPVVVNVFGSWCEPCRQEIPHFLELRALRKVAIVGVDVEEANLKAGRDFVIKMGISWSVLFDSTSVTRGIFGLGVPVTWFIDAQGKVMYKQIGIITSTAELKSEVRKYLKIRL